MLMERFLLCSNVTGMKKEFNAATSTGSHDAFEEVMKKYGTGVISQVGSEVRCMEPNACELTMIFLWG
jgi:hypothetical protein